MRTDAPHALVAPLPLVAVDWSVRQIHVTFDGRSVTVMRSLDELLDQLDRPHRIVAEATLESWEPRNRARLADRARREGHERSTAPSTRHAAGSGSVSTSRMPTMPE